MNKINLTLKKIILALRAILKNNPNFTGEVRLNFHLGGLTDIKKTENLKIK